MQPAREMRGGRCAVLILLHVQPEARRETLVRLPHQGPGEGVGDLLAEIAAVPRGVMRTFLVVQQRHAAAQAVAPQRPFHGEAAVHGVAGLCKAGDLRLELAPGLAGDVVDRATKGVAAEIGVLRSLDDFDTLDVDRIDRLYATQHVDAVDEHCAGLLTRQRGAEGQAAEIEVAGETTAGTVAADRLEVHARRHRRQVTDVVDLLLLDLLGGESRDGERHLEQCLGTFAGGHEDFLEGRVGRCTRLLRLCQRGMADRRDHSQRDRRGDG